MANMKNGPPKHLQIAEELSRCIKRGEYSVGTTLPSIRKLSREFRTSSATMLKVFRHLESRELIKTRNGRSGTLVVSSHPLEAERQTAVACLFRRLRPRNDYDNFGLDIIEGVRHEVARRNCHPSVICLDESNYEDRLLRLVRGGKVLGLILDGYTPDDLLKRVALSGVPTVMFNRIPNGVNIGAVTPDYEAMGRETFRLLTGKGYRRIAYFWHLSEKDRLSNLRYPYLAAELGVLEAAAAQGWPAEAMEWVPEVPPAEGDMYEPEQFGLPRRKPADWVPLGVIAVSDARARRWMEAIRRTDLVLGRDIGVVGGFDLECNWGSEQPFSTWKIDRASVGEEAVRELFRRVADPEPPRTVVKLRMEFADRGTA